MNYAVIMKLCNKDPPSGSFTISVFDCLLVGSRWEHAEWLQGHYEIAAEGVSWTVVDDPNAKKPYFHNPLTQRSQWSDPRTNAVPKDAADAGQSASWDTKSRIMMLGIIVTPFSLFGMFMAGRISYLKVERYCQSVPQQGHFSNLSNASLPIDTTMIAAARPC